MSDSLFSKANGRTENLPTEKPMKDTLGVSPSKGNQGTTRGKKNSFDLGRNRTHDLRIRSTVTLQW